MKSQILSSSHSQLNVQTRILLIGAFQELDSLEKILQICLVLRGNPLVNQQTPRSQDLQLLPLL